MSLELHIEALLFEHDCVIVPEFGGFVANRKDGHKEEITGRYFPARKHITFNKNLQSNDGLLATNMSREQKISYADALGQIREQVLLWKAQIGKNGRLMIGDIGKIYTDKEQNWQFEQKSDLNFLTDSFGLGSIKPIPVIQPITKETTVVEEDETPIIEFQPIVIEEKSSSKSGKILKYALAVACILPVAFYSYWIPSNTLAVERGFLKLSDFNPFSIQAEPDKYSIRKNSPVEFSKPENLADLNELTLESEDGNRTFVVETKSEKVVKEPRGHFHLIGGCFRNETYALNQINELKAQGYSSYLLDRKNGLHRVCIQTFTTKSEADSAKSTLGAIGISGWVLTK